MPYAAKATIEHEFDTDHLLLYVTFDYPMQRYIRPLTGPPPDALMPPLAKWLLEGDDVEIDIAASVWLDEYTLQLTSDTVVACPAIVTLEYAGPDVALTTAWEKQWEPFGPIPSTFLMDALFLPSLTIGEGGLTIVNGSANVANYVNAVFITAAIPGTDPAVRGMVSSKIAQTHVSAGNAAGAETDLASYTIPPTGFYGDGSTWKLSAFGVTSSSASTNKRIRVHFGGTNIFDYTGGGAAAGQAYGLEIDIVVYGSNLQKAIVAFSSTLGPMTPKVVCTMLGENTTSGVTLRITGSGTNASDVVLYASKLFYEPSTDYLP